MNKKRKKVLCIDSDFSFLEEQERDLSNKDLAGYFFSFIDFFDAVHFIEKQIIAKNDKLDYILMDEEIAGKQLDSSLAKISKLKSHLNKPDVIVSTSNNSNDLRNRVMQHSFINALLVKPIPENYIEFLITGNHA